MVDPLRDHTAGVFTTFPAFPNIPVAGLYDQILGTALLLIIILAVTDIATWRRPATFHPSSLGLVSS